MAELTAAQALHIPAFVSPADAQTLVRWADEARPVLEAFVARSTARRLPKAEREAAHQAHVTLALLATIVQADRALRLAAEARADAEATTARLGARVEEQGLQIGRLERDLAQANVQIDQLIAQRDAYARKVYAVRRAIDGILPEDEFPSAR